MQLKLFRFLIFAFFFTLEFLPVHRYRVDTVFYAGIFGEIVLNQKTLCGELQIERNHIHTPVNFKKCHFTPANHKTACMSVHLSQAVR